MGILRIRATVQDNPDDLDGVVGFGVGQGHSEDRLTSSPDLEFYQSGTPLIKIIGVHKKYDATNNDLRIVVEQNFGNIGVGPSVSPANWESLPLDFAVACYDLDGTFKFRFDFRDAKTLSASDETVEGAVEDFNSDLSLSNDSTITGMTFELHDDKTGGTPYGNTNFTIGNDYIFEFSGADFDSYKVSRDYLTSYIPNRSYFLHDTFYSDVNTNLPKLYSISATIATQYPTPEALVAAESASVYDHGRIASEFTSVLDRDSNLHLIDKNEGSDVNRFRLMLNEPTIYVDVSATGNEDGSSLHDAYTNISDLPSNTPQGSQVLVKTGTAVGVDTLTQDIILTINNGELTPSGLGGTISDRLVNLTGVAPNNVFTDLNGATIANKSYDRGYWVSNVSDAHRVEISLCVITNGTLTINNGIAYGTYQGVEGALVLYDKTGNLVAVAFDAKIN